MVRETAPETVREALLEPDAVQALLPHRGPMLLVDRVLDLQPGRRIVAAKAVTVAEACYAEIEPGAPSWAYRYPDALVLESLGQAAALLWLAGRNGRAGTGQVLVFGGARDCWFTGDALPGDVLIHEVELTWAKGDAVLLTGRTRVGERTVLDAGTLLAAVRSGEDLRGRRGGPSPPGADGATVTGGGHATTGEGRGTSR